MVSYYILLCVLVFEGLLFGIFTHLYMAHSSQQSAQMKRQITIFCYMCLYLKGCYLIYSQPLYMAHSSQQSA